MAEHQLPLIAPETAEKARTELLSALHVADNPAAWMDFMESVTRLLPEILSPGRPSTDAIKRSPIGQLGFKSWQAMIEAPADAHGLAWNFSQWKAWRRAWATVQANPWLRSQPLSSSEINNIAIEFKPFPESLEALQALRQAKVATTEQKRADTLAEVQRALIEAGGRLKVLEEQLHQEREANTQLSSEAGRLRGEVEQLQAQLNVLRETPAPSVKLSRFQHFCAFLFGS
jgi:hypothetical protein